MCGILRLTMVPKKNQRVADPDQGDQNIDRPLQFGVFLAAGDAQWQRNCR